jgi:hypothetical protein
VSPREGCAPAAAGRGPGPGRRRPPCRPWARRGSLGRHVDVPSTESPELSRENRRRPRQVGDSPLPRGEGCSREA